MTFAVSSITGAGMADLKGMDTETMIMAVVAYRADNMENRLRNKMEDVQSKNVQMDKLNKAMTSLSRVKAEFKADAKTTDKVGDQAGLKSPPGGINNLLKNAHDSVSATGMRAFVSAKGDADSHSYVLPSHTMSEVDAAHQTLKTKSDSMSTIHSTDMLELQSYIAKNNECAEIRTNVMKKLQSPRDSIISNIR